MKKEWPLWEVFIRSRSGLDHRHAGSVHAADAAMALENARDVYDSLSRLRGSALKVAQMMSMDKALLPRWLHKEFQNPHTTFEFFLLLS